MESISSRARRSEPTKIPVYILAGGRSSRFGSDKARATVEGETLIARIARLLQPWTETLTVVADSAGKYQDLGLETIADIHPGAGPLSGLHAALRNETAPTWIFLTSCDMLHAEPDWMERLLAETKNNPQAIIFQHKSGMLEPLFGLYHTSLSPECEARLTERALSISTWLREMNRDGKARLVPLPEDWPALAHVNTRAELNQSGLAARKDFVKIT